MSSPANDAVLRAFERALRQGDPSEVMRLAPGVLARARSTPEALDTRCAVTRERRRRGGGHLRCTLALGHEGPHAYRDAPRPVAPPAPADEPRRCVLVRAHGGSHYFPADGAVIYRPPSHEARCLEEGPPSPRPRCTREARIELEACGHTPARSRLFSCIHAPDHEGRCIGAEACPGLVLFDQLEASQCERPIGHEGDCR